MSDAPEGTIQKLADFIDRGFDYVLAFICLLIIFDMSRKIADLICTGST
jgi:hypothetical protein